MVASSVPSHSSDRTVSTGTLAIANDLAQSSRAASLANLFLRNSWRAFSEADSSASPSPSPSSSTPPVPDSLSPSAEESKGDFRLAFRSCKNSTNTQEHEYAHSYAVDCS